MQRGKGRKIEARIDVTGVISHAESPDAAQKRAEAVPIGPKNLHELTEDCFRFNLQRQDPRGRKDGNIIHQAS